MQRRRRKCCCQSNIINISCAVYRLPMHESTCWGSSYNISKQLKCAGLQCRDNHDEVFTSFLGRLHPPTTSRMATTNPSLKRSPGQRYYWRTWKKKWFFYIAHLKCWHIEENTNLVAFCPWDYWTLLQGDFLKILVIFWIFFLLIFHIFTHWLSSSLGQSAPWGKLAPAVWNKNLIR